MGFLSISWSTKPKIKRSTKPKIKTIPAPNNWDGVPPPDLKWEDLINTLPVVRSIVAWPDKCPTCGKSLTKYESDPVMIEVEMCHQVLGVFCDEGHYTFLECM